MIAGDYIDICRIYTAIFEKTEMIQIEQASLGNYNNNAAEGMDLKRRFAQQVEGIAVSDYTSKVSAIPAYLKNRTSRNVKEVLENIANRIQKFTYKEKRHLENFDVQRLIDLYSGVIDIYMENPGNDISEQQYHEYKEMAKIIDKVMQRG